MVPGDTANHLDRKDVMLIKQGLWAADTTSCKQRSGKKKKNKQESARKDEEIMVK